MKNKIIFPLLTILALTSCSFGKKVSPGGGNNDSDSSSETSTSEETKYSISDGKYSEIRNKFTKKTVLFEENFTISNSISLKVAQGKVEYSYSNVHTIYNFKTSSYNASTGVVEGDYYSYQDNKWVSYHTMFPVNNIILSVRLDLLETLPNSLSGLTYNVETHVYTCNATYNSTSIKLELSFLDENLKTLRASANGTTVTYDFSDYGNTSVNIPNV